MAGVVDAVVSFASDEPALVGIMVAMVVLVFVVYLFLRRTLLNVREGYESGYRK
jgi:hypothetical protein